MVYQRPQTPKEAWAALLEGNRHFVSGEPAHPRQDVDRRESVAEIQSSASSGVKSGVITPTPPAA